MAIKIEICVERLGKEQWIFTVDGEEFVVDYLERVRLWQKLDSQISWLGLRPIPPSSEIQSKLDAIMAQLEEISRFLAQGKP